jgi:hypothetical protein
MNPRIVKNTGETRSPSEDSPIPVIKKAINPPTKPPTNGLARDCLVQCGKPRVLAKIVPRQSSNAGHPAREAIPRNKL